MKFYGKAPRSRLERVVCPLCEREVGGRVPKDGDGSGLWPVWHKVDGLPCGGRFHEAQPARTLDAVGTSRAQRSR